MNNKIQVLKVQNIPGSSNGSMTKDPTLLVSYALWHKDLSSNPADPIVSSH